MEGALHRNTESYCSFFYGVNTVSLFVPSGCLLKRGWLPGTLNPPRPVLDGNSGRYLRVRLDFDVILRDESFRAVQLGFVPVLVVFHIEDLKT